MHRKDHPGTLHEAAVAERFLSYFNHSILFYSHEYVTSLLSRLPKLSGALHFKIMVSNKFMSLLY